MNRIVGIFAIILLLAAPAASGTIVEVWIDISGSLDEGEARRTLETLAESFVRVPHLERVDLFPFWTVADALRGPMVSIEAPEAPHRVECAPPTEVEALHRAAADRRLIRCEERENTQRSAYLERWMVFRKELLGAFAEIDLATNRERTCLAQALARATSTAPKRRVIFLTDGWHRDCPDVQPQRTEGDHVLVLLCPSVDDGLEAVGRSLERRSWIEQFGDVTIANTYEIEEVLPSFLNQ